MTSTITSLPGPLLDSLLPNLSTLASVYHKPPSAFLGHGRSSATALQQAAIDEAAENARENPLAAAAAAAVMGKPVAQAGNHAENLLDIDFDGAAPASLQKAPGTGASGLEGLAGTPQRVASPLAAGAAPAQQMGGLEDLMGVFGDSGSGSGNASAGGFGGAGGNGNELMDGFAGLDMSSQTQPPPARQQLNNAGGGGGGGKKTTEDLLGMF